MRTLIASVVVGLLACGVGLAVAEHHEGELAKEMEKCSVCKSMAKPELMKHMTWETHKIENGMLCVASVPKEQKKEFDAAHQEMTKAIAAVTAAAQSGQKPELCGFCEGMGELTKAGAKQQEIATKTGAISLITSSDPAVLAKIHAQADKAIEMQKKMAEHEESGG